MKFHLEAEPGELEEKGAALVKTLLAQFDNGDPRISAAIEAFEKAEKDPLSDQGPLRFAVMRELFHKKKAVYAEQTAAMMSEIETVLKG